MLRENEFGEGDSAQHRADERTPWLTTTSLVEAGLKRARNMDDVVHRGVGDGGDSEGR